MPTDPQRVQHIDIGADTLRAMPSIDDEQRADLWDQFHQSDSPEDLEQRLHAYPDVAEDVKSELIHARGTQDRIGRLDAVQPSEPKTETPTDALMEMAQLPPEVLSIAEAHPKTAKAFIDAAAARRGE